jgi:hypothetical protein
MTDPYNAVDPDDMAIAAAAVLRQAGHPAEIAIEFEGPNATAIIVRSNDREVAKFPMHPVQLTVQAAALYAAMLQKEILR